MQKERLLSEYLNWQDYYQGNMILHTDHSVSMMLSLDGTPFETIDDPIINHRHSRLEAGIRDVGQDGLTFGFLQCRGIADPAIYPRGEFRTEFARRLDQRYYEGLFGRKAMWLNRTYMWLHLSPRRVMPGPIKRLIGRNKDVAKDVPSERIRQLRTIVNIFGEHLKEYRPRILGITKRGRFYFTEIAEAVSFAMTGYWRPVPLTTSGAASVFSETFFIGHETFEVRMPHKSSWGANLNMRDFPYQTEPGMYDKFLSSDYRHTVYHGFRCLTSLDGQGLATRRQNTMKSAGDRALTQRDELTHAANLIASNRMMMGDYAFSVTLFADDAEALPTVVQKAWGDLNYGGVKIERENLALEAALFSSIPGNFDLRTTPAAVSSRNFSAFASVHNFPVGASKGFWGDPIGMLRTSGGTPFLFHLHVDGVGNSFVSGTTGSGKTTYLGWLICQLERSGAQIILWDKDRGLEALIRALEGAYMSLTNAPGIGTGLAPLKRLTNSPEDLAFLAGLIRACISTPDPYLMSPEEDRRLEIALRTVMSLPPEDRDLSEVRAFLGTSRTGAGARLEKWCWGKEFGWVIDCPRDSVDLDNKVIGFDQSAILEDPIASGATIATLFHYTGKLVDGRRLAFILDEVWKAFLLKQFLAEIRNGLKTWRKFNSPIIFGTQEVADALNSPIADTIKSQTPTKISFASPGASWKEYGPEGLKYTHTEFDIIENLPKGTGFFLLKQGQQSVVVQAPMTGLDEVKVISGTANSVKALEVARKRTNDAGGMTLVEEYHRAIEELAA